MSGLAQARLAEERKSFRKSRPFGFSAKPKSRPDGSVNLLVREPSPCSWEVITCRQCMPPRRPHVIPPMRPPFSPVNPLVREPYPVVGRWSLVLFLPPCAPVCPRVPPWYPLVSSLTQLAAAPRPDFR